MDENELDAFIAYLKKRNLQICMLSKNLGYTTLNVSMDEFVENWRSRR